MDGPIQVTDEDLDNAALTLLGEARGATYAEQVADAWVIRTRASWQPPAWWGHTVSDVCCKAKQFSCWNGNDPNYAVIMATSFDSQLFLGLREIARGVFAGEVPDPATDRLGCHPTHYEVVGTGAKWSKNKPIARIIGRTEYFVIGPG